MPPPALVDDGVGRRAGWLAHVAQGDYLVEQRVGIAANGEHEWRVRQKPRPFRDHAVEEHAAQAFVGFQTSGAQRPVRAGVQRLMVASDAAATFCEKHFSRVCQQRGSAFDRLGGRGRLVIGRTYRRRRGILRLRSRSSTDSAFRSLAFTLAPAVSNCRTVSRLGCPPPPRA